MAVLSGTVACGSPQAGLEPAACDPHEPVRVLTISRADFVEWYASTTKVAEHLIVTVSGYVTLDPAESGTAAYAIPACGGPAVELIAMTDDSDVVIVTAGPWVLELSKTTGDVRWVDPEERAPRHLVFEAAETCALRIADGLALVDADGRLQFHGDPADADVAPVPIADGIVVPDSGPRSNGGDLECSKSARDVPIVDLEPLAGLDGLETLEFEDTAVSDLSPLAGLPQLASLMFAGAAIDDISPLAQLPALWTLDASRTGVASVEPLIGSVELYALRLEGTSVADVSMLAGLPDLRVLVVGNTPISDVSAFAESTLSGLFANATNVGVLPSNMGCEHASFADDGLVDIAPLLSWTRPTEIDLAGNAIDDLSALLDMPWAYGGGSCLRIDLRGNPLGHPETAAIMQQVCAEFGVELIADDGLSCQHALCGVVDG